MVGDSSGRCYVSERWHNVPLLSTRGLDPALRDKKKPEFIQTLQLKIGKIITDMAEEFKKTIYLQNIFKKK